MATAVDDIESGLRALNEARMKCAAALGHSARALESARAELVEREREYAKAHSDALSAGWTAAELKKVGIEEPERRAPGRPKGATTRRNRTAAESAADAAGSAAATDAPTPATDKAVPAVV
ncbi:hypothetical protein [Kineococcus indalonis]|uniref:hypothetical protein n=1 Tax=Kineococcus indalonis TaxID=2696566 RepID=UPI001412FF73|nr:hypothetical protein [Kineococcus indalonis]NAZ84627.1 hypothetical protein [Kineococcus indalonis]